MLPLTYTIELLVNMMYEIEIWASHNNNICGFHLSMLFLILPFFLALPICNWLFSLYYRSNWLSYDIKAFQRSLRNQVFDFYLKILQKLFFYLFFSFRLVNDMIKHAIIRRKCSCWSIIVILWLCYACFYLGISFECIRSIFADFCFGL